MAHFIDPATGVDAVHELDPDIVGPGTLESDFINYGTDNNIIQFQNSNWSSMFRMDVLTSYRNFLLTMVNATSGTAVKTLLNEAASTGALSLYEAGILYTFWAAQLGFGSESFGTDGMTVLLQASGGDKSFYQEFNVNTTGDNIWNPDGTTSNADGTKIDDPEGTGTGTTEIQPPGFGAGWTENEDGTFTDPNGNIWDNGTGTWKAFRPDGTSLPADYDPGVSGNNPPVDDPPGFGADWTSNEDGTKTDPAGDVWNWNGTEWVNIGAEGTGGAGGTPPSDLPFIDNAGNIIFPGASLENQRRDPFRDVALREFQDLSLPGQQALMSTRDFFNSGFGLRGFTDDPQAPFSTFEDFLTQGGAPMTALQAAQALQSGRATFQDLLQSGGFTDQQLQEIRDAVESGDFSGLTNELASLGQFFINGDTSPDALVGLADERFGAVFNPLQQQASSLVSTPLMNTINFMRDLFNANRTSATDSFFIDDFLANDSLVSGLLSPFEQATDFVGTSTDFFKNTLGF